MRTVTRLSRWLCIPVLLPLWPAAGQKPGELYVSPLKNFSIAVPKFAFGTRVQKSNNRDGGLVVFIGGGCARLPAADSRRSCATGVWQSFSGRRDGGRQ